MMVCRTVEALLVFITLLATEAANHSPIMIIPGITGSQLYVQHRDSEEGKCDTHDKFAGLWISETRLREDLGNGCASKELMLVYDKATDSYYNMPNVDVIAPGVGDVTLLEHVDTYEGHPISRVPNFDRFTDYFVTNHSYVRGKDLRGAPYDWRLAPDELKKRGYFALVKQQIEDMYSQSNNTKVTIVVQSMGGPTILYFLDPKNKIVTQDWKDEYLHAFISLSGAWAGSPLALKQQVSGGFLKGIGKLIHDRNISRTLESVYWLLPSPEVFNDSTVLMRTPAKAYTAHNYQTIFTDIHFSEGYTMYEGVKNLIKEFPPPGVPTYCYWGVETDTPLTYNYSENFPQGADKLPTVIDTTDGDGIVNAIASQVCLKWKNDLVQSKTFPKVTHVEMARNYDVIGNVSEVVVPGPGGRPKSHSKPSDKKYMEGMLDPISSGTLKAYENIQKMIRKMLKMARINNYNN